MSSKGHLTFFCGKMGAGKSTLSRKIANETDAVLLSEDEWLATLYGQEIQDFSDYLKYSSRIKPLVKSHVQDLLSIGVSVVMDFPGNTLKQRAWFQDIFEQTEYPHKLIYLNVSDELCLKQIRHRREACPERKNFDTEEVFHHVTQFFQAPSVDERFNIEIRDNSQPPINNQ